MKKILIIMAILMIVIVSHEEEGIVIPSSAIRFRVIANSNTIEDQSIKNSVAKYIEDYVIDLTKNAKNSEEAKEILLNNYKNIEAKVDNYMDMNNIDMNFNISIGKNFFPRKIYKGITYDAGYYDSLVLSLGKKEGINWWCVMYPPLCLIDRNPEVTNIEVTSLTKELLNKYSK